MATRSVELDFSAPGFEDVVAKIDEISEKVDALLEKFRELSEDESSPHIEVEGLDEAKVDIDDLDEKLDDLDIKDSTPHVEVEGVDEASEKLDIFNAEIDDATASLLAMGPADDEVTASNEALAESFAELRDRAAESLGPMDLMTATELANAEAGMDNVASLKAFEQAMRENQASAAGLWPTLRLLQSELGNLGNHESLLVTANGLDQYIVQTDSELEGLNSRIQRVHGSLTTTAEDLKQSGLEEAQTFIAAGAAIDDYRAKLHSLALDLEGVDEDAKAIGRDLEFAVGEGGSGLGVFQRLGSFFTNGGDSGGFFGAISEFFGAGEGGMSAILSSVGSFSAGIAVIAPAIVAIGVGLDGLASGASAAAIGLGSMAVLAYPAFEKVSAAIDDTHAQLMKLPVAERDTIEGVQQLKAAYDKMALSFQPEAFKLFNDAVKVANSLLPSLKPLADAAADSVGGLLQQLNKAVSSKQWKEGVTALEPYIKAAIPAIAHGLWEVGVAFSNMFAKMSPKDAAHDITDFFGVITFVLNRITYAIGNVMNMWDDLSAAFRASRNWFDDTTRAVMQFSDNLSHWYHDAERDVDGFNSLLSGWATDAERDFDHFNELLSDWASDAERDFDHVGALILGWAVDVGNWFTDAGHKIESIWDSAGSMLESATVRMVDDIIHWFEDLPSDMERIGADIIHGLLSGLESSFGGVIGWVENAASDISHAFASVLGILSPSRVFFEHGQNIVRGLVMGIDAGLPQVRSTMDRLGAEVMPGSISAGRLATAGGAVGSASNPMTLSIEFNGGANSEFMTALKKMIRIRGGNVTVVGR